MLTCATEIKLRLGLDNCAMQRVLRTKVKNLNKYITMEEKLTSSFIQFWQFSFQLCRRYTQTSGATDPDPELTGDPVKRLDLARIRIKMKMDEVSNPVKSTTFYI